MLDNEIIAHWGRDNLVRWNPVLLDQVNLPDSSKAFLAEVGLPNVPRFIGTLDLSWDLKLPWAWDEDDRRVLGRHWGHPLLLDEAANGAVIFARSPADQHFEARDECIFNTSVERFAACLTLYDVFCASGTFVDITEEQRAIQDFWDRIAPVDPSVMAMVHSRWPDKVFEMCLEAGGPEALKSYLLGIDEAWQRSRLK